MCICTINFKFLDKIYTIMYYETNKQILLLIIKKRGSKL